MSEEMNNQEEKVMTPEETIAMLKENTVPRADMEALSNKYNKLLNAYATGTVLGTEPPHKTEEEKAKEVADIVRSVASHKVRGAIEHMKAAIATHDYLVEHGQRSCFAPQYGDVTVDGEKACNDFRDLLANAVEVADGDDQAAMDYYARNITGFAVENKKK